MVRMQHHNNGRWKVICLSLTTKNIWEWPTKVGTIDVVYVKPAFIEKPQ